MRFFVGLHQPSDAQHFERAFVSINRIRNRRSSFEVSNWIMDSGAFTELERHGQYRHPPEAYAAEARRWMGNGKLLRVVAQDYMCEPFMLSKTGLSVEDHQDLTIERYDALVAAGPDLPIMPVLQGYDPREYIEHIRQYGDRLTPNMWVGVGSVCKRNAEPHAILAVLDAIRSERDDLRLHGFGVKSTSLQCRPIREGFYSADSMAWSFAARMAGRNANDWREARAFRDRIENPGYLRPVQMSLGLEAA